MTPVTYSPLRAVYKCEYSDAAGRFSGWFIFGCEAEAGTLGSVPKAEAKRLLDEKGFSDATSVTVSALIVDSAAGYTVWTTYP